jgi:hypothetical protein
MYFFRTTSLFLCFATICHIASVCCAQDVWVLNLHKTAEFTFVRQGQNYIEGEKPKPMPDFAVHQYDPISVYRVTVAADPDGSRFIALSYVSGAKSAGMIVKDIPISEHASGPYTVGFRYRLSDGAEAALHIGIKDLNGGAPAGQRFSLKRTADAQADGWELVTFPVTVTGECKLGLSWTVGPAVAGNTLFIKDIFVSRGADVVPVF